MITRRNLNIASIPIVYLLTKFSFILVWNVKIVTYFEPIKQLRFLTIATFFKQLRFLTISN